MNDSQMFCCYPSDQPFIYSLPCPSRCFRPGVLATGVESRANDRNPRRLASSDSAWYSSSFGAFKAGPREVCIVLRSVRTGFSWLSQPPASWTIAITHRSLVAGLWWGCLTASTPLPPSLAIPINSDCSAGYPQLVIRSTIINRANDAGLCAPYTSTRYMTIPAHFTEYRHGKEKKKILGWIDCTTSIRTCVPDFQYFCLTLSVIVVRILLIMIEQ